MKVAIAALLLGGCSVSGFSHPMSTGAPPTVGADDAADGDVAPPEVGEEMKTTRGKLPDGIPGKLCDQEGVDSLRNEYGYEGPCWDPPGYRIASLMPTAAIRGRRAVTPTANDTDAEIWWFDIPEASLLGSSNCASLQGAKEEFWHAYEPYEEDGFTPFVVEDFMGMPIAKVLDKLDALDLPVCVTVKSDRQCDDGHGKVCMQSTTAGDPVGTNGGLQFIVGTDVIDAGTADEQRRYPELVNRPVDEALADLKARGFTNVKVVEDRVQCERGIVCETEPGSGAQWVGTDEAIQLIVRRAKR